MASITRFYALILSIVLMLTGVPGFFPNVVTFQPLVTFFALTLVHSVVHTAVGLLGLLITALASDESVRIYTLGIALLYGALAAVGIAHIDFATVLTFNNADNWFHGAIFVLSLGVFLVGLADERLNRRTARIVDDLPPGRWAVPSAPASMGALAQRPQASGSVGAIKAAVTDEEPWYSQPQPQKEQPQMAWGQDPWQQYQQSPKQPTYQSPYQQRPSQLQSQPQPRPQAQPQLQYQQPSSQPRDPWTREQRHAPYPRSSNPASSPAAGQSRDPWNPWSQDAPPQDKEPARQPQEQWPLDEWPSLNDSKPTQ
jgi:uncharacterized protein DUF4383